MKFTNLFVALFATVILASCGGEATTESTEATEAPATEEATAPADTTAAPADSTAEAPAAE